MPQFRNHPRLKQLPNQWALLNHNRKHFELFYDLGMLVFRPSRFACFDLAIFHRDLPLNSPIQLRGGT
jgi:hypothetical protein